MNIEEFVEKVRNSQELQSALDEIVIDAKLQEATNLNNEGAEKQVEYLFSENPSSEDLEKLMAELKEINDE